MRKKITLSEQWAAEVYTDETSAKDSDQNLTFYGALQEVYWQVAYHWNKSTEKKNQASYDKVILPCMRDHNDKRISEYTSEDYEDTIETIRERGFQGPHGEQRYYSENTINSFKGLIYSVVYYSSVYGLCSNVLWGTDFQISLGENLEDDAIEEKIRLKKSLTPEEEIRFLNFFINNNDLSGEQIGLLIMLGNGLRNGETCALNYGDMRQLDGHPDVYTFWIYKSVKPKSSELQASGKTWNMGRIVPVPDKVVEIVLKRKEQLRQLLEEEGLSDEINIETLPIVNKGYLGLDTYACRCQSMDLTVVAKEAFQRIGMNPRELSYLEEELKDGGAEVVREKDPSAYLLRRNFATHAYLCGLTISEIQYVIGHDVEDAYESRSDFVDQERIYQIAKKLHMRPLLNDYKEEDNDIRINISNCNRVQIVARGLEPEDSLRVNVKGIPNDTEIETFSHPYSRNYSRTIDISGEYRHFYRKSEK